MKIGIVGLGYWGPKILRNLATMKDIDIVLCDKDKDLLLAACNEYGQDRVIEGFTDFSEMLKVGLDGVIIATNPLSTHYPLAKEALEAGVSVWLEKPMTKDPKESQELVDLAKEKNLILHVDHTFIYSGPVQKIKEIIDSEVLGQIYSVDMRWLNLGIYQKDMDVVWDLCPHAFSMLTYWFGAAPDEIHKLNNVGGIDDTHIGLMYDTRAGFFDAHIHVSWNFPQKIRECVIVGTEKMLIYDDMAENKVVIYDKKSVMDDDTYEVSYIDNGAEIVEYNKTEPLLDECKHFIDCVKTGNKSISSGDDGLYVVNMLNEVSK